MQAALHPTPATCGRPRDKAQAALAESEPFDRGLFAGPFGWLSGSAAEFCVAIRSALISPAGPAVPAIAAEGPAEFSEADAAGMQQVLRLFAGVGVVKGSQAEAEWQVGCIACDWPTSASGLISRGCRTTPLML